ncbi:MAG: helix-turn-helix domain-containing protein [Kineosporiaceae bacterium]
MSEPVDDAGAAGSATVRRMLVGARLRRMREARGISREDAGYVIRASESKMSRLELGRVSFKERDVDDLLVHYGVTDAVQRESMLALVREANQSGWWRAYEDVLPGWFNNYVGLEEAAAGIRCYEIQFIPGLLQTHDYARAVISTAIPPPTPEELERAVALRMARQRILDRTRPPHLWAILDEAALRRPVGDDEVTKDQLHHLVELSGSPHVAIQVLPLRYGAHAAAGGAFSVLRFADADLPDVVYVEQLASALYLDKVDQVDRYTEVMNRLSVESLTPAESRDLLIGILEGIDGTTRSG